MAAGVLVYLKEEEIKRLLLDVIEEFPDSEIVFDIYSKAFVWLRNHLLANRKTNQKSKLLTRWQWGVNSAKAVAQWSDKIQVIDEFPYYSRIVLTDYWDKKDLSSLRMMNLFKSMKMVHLKLG